MSENNKEFILISEYFHPDTAKTGQLMTDLAVGLNERGLNLTVWTGQPNYHSGENQKQSWRSEFRGVLVKRMRAPQVRQTSLLRRLFNWAVFTIWMSISLLISRTKKEREIIFVSNPPFLAVILHIVCKIRGWEYTYIVHDLYPDQPVELGYLRENGIISKTWARLDNAALRGAKNVICLGQVMKDRIIQKAGPNIDEGKITIIHNWEDEEFIEPMDKEENWFSEEHDLVEPFTVLYSGNIGEFHDLESLVQAAAAFEDENVKFLIIGEGDNKAKITSMAEELDIRGDTVEFLPYQQRDDLPYSLTAGDVSVVTVNRGFEGVCVSSKLYTAMAAGMPVLGIVQPYDDEARIIDVFNAGLHAKQGDVDGIIEAINTWQTQQDLVKNQGQNARTAFEEYFTKDHSIDRYYRLLTGKSLESDVTQTMAN